MKLFVALLLPLLVDSASNMPDIMRLFSQQNPHFDSLDPAMKIYYASLIDDVGAGAKCRHNGTIIFRNENGNYYLHPETMPGGMYDEVFINFLKNYWTMPAEYMKSPEDEEKDREETIAKGQKAIDELEEALAKIKEAEKPPQSEVLDLFAARHAKPNRRIHRDNLRYERFLNEYADEDTQSETDVPVFGDASDVEKDDAPRMPRNRRNDNDRPEPGLYTIPAEYLDENLNIIGSRASRRQASAPARASESLNAAPASYRRSERTIPGPPPVDRESERTIPGSPPANREPESVFQAPASFNRRSQRTAQGPPPTIRESERATERYSMPVEESESVAPASEATQPLYYMMEDSEVENIPEENDQNTPSSFHQSFMDFLDDLSREWTQEY